jgi:hypothetical protein
VMVSVRLTFEVPVKVAPPVIVCPPLATRKVDEATSGTVCARPNVPVAIVVAIVSS